MLKISNTYLVGVDIDENAGESKVIVEKIEGSKREVVKQFTGEEAQRMFYFLCGVGINLEVNPLIRKMQQEHFDKLIDEYLSIRSRPTTFI